MGNQESRLAPRAGGNEANDVDYTSVALVREEMKPSWASRGDDESLAVGEDARHTYKKGCRVSGQIELERRRT